jgi:glycosyltransferase involved in cell wall biosynthesis
MRLVASEHWGKLHVVRCGLQLSDLPVRRRSGPARQIISVGRLSAEKGHAGLLEAFSSLLPDCPDIELVLAGDGPESGRLRAIADRLGISGRVRFTGRLSERDALEGIAQADILVVSSFMEGLPIVLIEAMALGTPVIATRVAGIPELVEDGKSGLLFTPSKWDELADCIRRLVGDDALRANWLRREDPPSRASSTSIDWPSNCATCSQALRRDHVRGL